LPGLALNHDPPDLCLLNSYEYRREPPVPTVLVIFEIGSQELLAWLASNCNPSGLCLLNS
jgi:hypothetical protein